MTSLISEKLAGFYTKAEDKYFDVLDFLDSKGLPVYKYSDFFENRGIPSFVVTVSIIVLILLMLSLALTYRGPDVSELTLSLRDAEGKGIQNMKVVITDAKGDILFEGIKSDGDKVQLKRGLYIGETISITASKDAYQTKTIDFTVGKDNTVPQLSFQSAFEGIDAKIKVIDKETKTLINEATIIATAQNLSFQFNYDSNGTYKNSGVPSGVTLLLKISSEGYNNYEQQTVFNSAEVRTIELTPSSQGYVGKASVAITVQDSDEKTISDAKVTVYDLSKSIIVLSNYTNQGMIIGEVQAGVPLRIVVEKQGYLTYDSEKENASVTIREKEKQIIITLIKGGQKLHVSVIDSASGFGVEGATVGIYDLEGKLFAEQTAKISGADFTGLDGGENVYVTAYMEGYLPVREKIALSASEEVKLVLEKITSTNSARLDIYSVDKLGTAINGVNVTIFEILDGNKVPYGMIGLQTTFAGYVAATVAVNKTYELIGTTEVMEGIATIEVKTGEADKKVYLNMVKKAKILEMKFIDAYGKDIYGNARVSGLDGATLYDGNIQNSRVFFDSEQREVVEVQVDLPDGNTFTENVTVKGKDYVEVMVYNKEASALAPIIEFVGLEDELGSEVKGIIPGAFFWAKFTVVYPKAATRGGVHFRSGSDTVAFSESEKFAVYDLSFQGAEIAQSSSYTSTPEPGNEVVDRSNKTVQGDKSKWVEGTIANPIGTYAVKVKVRAEDFTEGTVQLHYRAWTLIGSEYYRNPDDATLLTSAFSDKKSGLYAETLIKDLAMYESLPECSESICISVNYVDEEEKFLEEKGFEALKDKVYGLEIQVTSLEADYIQVSATTDGNIVDFTSTQTGNFNFVRESDFNKSGETKATAAVALSADGKEKIRFYFKAKSVGTGLINLTVVGKSSVTKDLQFNVVSEKTLLVELSESQVMAGRNFTVKVTDQGLKGIEGALVKIIDKEDKPIKSILGDGSDGKGKNGYFRVQNDMSVGLYTVEVSAPTYATVAVPLLITTQNVLTFAENIEVKLPLGQKAEMVSEILSNNSEFTVQNIAIETTGEKSTEKANLGESVSTSENGKFKITAIAPPALGAGQKQAVQLNVNYIGGVDETADETATITISGFVEGKFLTKVSSEVHMVYNRQLDPSCLKVEPSSVTINLLGSAGSTDSETIEVTNGCDQAVFLKKRVRENTKKSYILVDAEELDLQQGETKNITITANNLIDRANAREQTFSYSVVYDSNYLKKTIGVSVKIINPAFALSYPPQVTLWLAQSNPQEKAVAAQPIFVTNISSFPVENINFAVNREYASGANVKVEVAPSGVVTLERGQAITPPKVVYAEAASKISEPVRSRIEITGRLGQLNNRSGQNDRYNYYDDYYSGTNTLNTYSPKQTNYYQNQSEVLGMIEVIVYYSGYNCLTARPGADIVGDLSYYFPMPGTEIGKKVIITNKCAEPMRVVGATPAGQTQNTINPILGVPRTASSIIMSLPMVTVQPGQAITVPMTISTAIPNIKRNKYGVVINAIAELSGTPVTSKPFYINILAGSEIDSERQKAAKLKAKICTNKPGETIEEDITVPKVSDNYNAPNCGEAYCDAKNAAKYLEMQIRKVIDSARSKGYGSLNKEDTFDCAATGACTFEELGIDPEYINLYLQNDDLTAGILQKELNGTDMEAASTTPFRETAGSTGFMVIPEIVELDFLKSRVMTGYDRTIFLDRQIQGCGYYQLIITGAFKSSVEGIDPMTPAISIRARPQNGTARLVTKECQSSITNVANFNPIDEGLNPGSDYGTWLTTIETDTLLKDIAISIAKDRYKSEKRVSAGSGNKLVLIKGALSDALAQMCISGGERKTITVTVDSAIATNLDKGTKDTYGQAIVKLVKDGLAGTFGDNCLVKTGEIYSCVKLTDVGSLGSRAIKLQTNTLPLNESSESCISGTIYSTVPETLLFEAEPISPSEAGKNFFGIGKIVVKANDQYLGPEFKLDNATAAATPQPAPTTPQVATNNTPSQPNPLTPTTPGTTPSTSGASKPSATVSSEEKILKASFAEIVPTPTTNPQAGTPPTGTPPVGTPKTGPPQGTNPNPQATSATPERDARKEYYVAEYWGGNLRAETINEAIVLKAVQGSKDYRYYRNIKICAYASDPTIDLQAKTNDGLPLYMQANGVQFNIGIKAVNQAQPERGAKEKITINTGTIHPEDLVTKLLTPGQVEKDKVYYFTPMWFGGTNAINLRLYSALLIRQGKLDSLAGGGAEKTGMDKAAESNTKSSAVMKYLEVCGITSATCNFAVAGPGGALFGALLDCGAPLFGPLRKDFLGTDLGRKILGGVESVANVLLGVLSNLVGFFTTEKPNWNWNLTNMTATADSWNAETLKTDTAIYGSVAGSLTPLPKVLGWRNPGYINSISGGWSGNIDYYAESVAEQYRKAAESSFRKSLDITATSAVKEADLKVSLDAYKKSIKETISKGLTEKYNTAWSRSKLGATFKTPASLSVEETLGAVISEKQGEIAFGNYYTKVGKSGTSPIQDLFGGVKIDDALSTPGNNKLIKLGSELETAVKAGTGLNTGALDTKLEDLLRKTGWFKGEELPLGTKVQAAEIKPLVERFVEESLPGATAAERASVSSGIMTRLGPTIKFEGAQTRTVVPATARVPAVTEVVPGDSVGKIRAAIISNAQTEIQTQLKAGNLKGVTKQISEQLAKSADEIAKETAKDVAKSGKVTGRLKALLSLRTAKLVGAGIGCGLLANAAGMYSYGEETKAYEKARQAQINYLPNKVLEKGKVYKLVIEKSEGAVLIYDAKDTITQEKKIGVQYNQKLVNPTGKKSPEERELGVYPIKTSRTIALEQMEGDVDFLEYYANSEQSKLLTSTPLTRYMNPNLQYLVNKYTSTLNLDCTTKKAEINDPAGLGAGLEPLAITIAATEGTRNEYSVSDIEAETKGENSANWLKTKLQQAIDLSGKNNGVVDKSVAEQLFKGKTPAQIDRFVKDYLIWQEAFKASPNLDALCDVTATMPAK